MKSKGRKERWEASWVTDSSLLSRVCTYLDGGLYSLADQAWLRLPCPESNCGDVLAGVQLETWNVCSFTHVCCCCCCRRRRIYDSTGPSSDPLLQHPGQSQTNQELLFVSSQLYEDWQYDVELPWNQSRSWEIHNSMNQWTMTEVTTSSELISTQYSFPYSRIPINIIPHISKQIYVMCAISEKV